MVPHELLPRSRLLFHLPERPRQILLTIWTKIPKLDDEVPRILRLLLLLFREHVVLGSTSSRVNLDLLTRHFRPGSSHLARSVERSGTGEPFPMVEIRVEERGSNELARVAYVDQGQPSIAFPRLGKYVRAVIRLGFELFTSEPSPLEKHAREQKSIILTPRGRMNPN